MKSCMKKYRDWQKRIIFVDAVYFVTSKICNNYLYFREPIFCDLFVENLRLCKSLKGFLLYGWVLNYDHFHLLMQPNDKWNISKIIQFLKRHIARNINIVMDFNNDDRYPKGTIGTQHPNPEGTLGTQHPNPEGTLGTQHPNPEGTIGQSYLQSKCLSEIIYRFNKFVYLSNIRFRFKYGNQNPYPKFRWQKSFHDHYIRNDWDFHDKLDYISYNSEKHHLPDDWPYVFTNPKYDNLTDEIL